MLLGVFHARGTLLSLLTCRERTVMALLANGLDTPRLATALGVTEATVRTHLRHVLEKLGVHTRAEAVAKYLNPKISTTLR
jgi:DNA-binding CsgD family transcriptional regulator